jgi:hypothetical protein
MVNRLAPHRGDIHWNVNDQHGCRGVSVGEKSSIDDGSIVEKSIEDNDECGLSNDGDECDV